MTKRIREETIINVAREALILIEDGKHEEALRIVSPMNQLLAGRYEEFDPAVATLWAQISIASSNPDIWPRYLEDLRSRFLRVSDKYPEADGEPLEDEDVH